MRTETTSISARRKKKTNTELNKVNHEARARDSIHPRRMPRWLKKEEELCKDVL